MDDCADAPGWLVSAMWNLPNESALIRAVTVRLLLEGMNAAAMSKRFVKLPVLARCRKPELRVALAGCELSS